MIELYRGGWQLVKVRAIMWFALACGAGSLWWGTDLARRYGLITVDGGVLAPLPVRLAWAAGIWALGLVFLGGMWVYGRCYVARVDYDEQANALHIFTTGFVGSHRAVVELSGVHLGRYHDGRLDIVAAGWGGTATSNLALSVNAPWRAVKLAGRTLPLILDMQGRALQPELLEKLFSGKPARPRHRGG